jgi:hypothetical protein
MAQAHHSIDEEKTNIRDSLDYSVPPVEEPKTTTHPALMKIRKFFASNEFKKSCRPTVAVMVSCLFPLVRYAIISLLMSDSPTLQAARRHKLSRSCNYTFDVYGRFPFFPKHRRCHTNFNSFCFWHFIRYRNFLSSTKHSKVSPQHTDRLSQHSTLPLRKLFLRSPLLFLYGSIHCSAPSIPKNGPFL